jgi:transposase-like protein
MGAIVFRPKSSSTRFTLSFRDVEDLLAERGIIVSYETIPRWVNHFGPAVAADLRKAGRSPMRPGIWMRWST